MNKLITLLGSKAIDIINKKSSLKSLFYYYITVKEGSQIRQFIIQAMCQYMKGKINKMYGEFMLKNLFYKHVKNNLNQIKNWYSNLIIELIKDALVSLFNHLD